MKVYIDVNHNGVLDSTEPKTTTNAVGDYLFTTLNAGSFRVREVLPVGYRLSKPTSGYYDVRSGEGRAVTREELRGYAAGDSESTADV